MKTKTPKLKLESTQNFSKRKVDHIRFAADDRSQRLTSSGFANIHLQHNPLPELRFSDVDPSAHLLGHQFSTPLFVSSMTAGHEKSKSVNARLAKLAGARGWLMAVGSQKRELFDKTALNEWKKIRNANPTTKFVSNIGIEEVIQFKPAEIISLVDNLESIGLIVHLNSIQEMFQKNLQADVDLRGGLKAIAKLVKQSPVPVIVKEVGFGFSLDSIFRLNDIGVAVIDLSGRGGSHWGMIEALRGRGEQGESLMNSARAFSDWGHTNFEMLKWLSTAKPLKSEIWASGGIRDGLEALKCVAMGAKGVGLAQPLMVACLKSENALLNAMVNFENQLKLGMFAMGVINLEQMQQGKYWYEV